MRKICLITPAHLANNPRLVKEADALSEAGYSVQVIACQYLDWATNNEQTILKSAGWSVQFIRYDRMNHFYLFWKSRLRQHFSVIFSKKLFDKKLRIKKLSWWNQFLALWAFSRVIPEMKALACRTPADLYIAHNLQALPVAFAAAKKWNAKLGFDAEDFHTGMESAGLSNSLEHELSRLIEECYLLECDYLTTASPGISAAYAEKYSISEPLAILNVFPLGEQPEVFRQTNASGPLRLYWFSQTIGEERGLEDIIRAMGKLKDCEIELHLRGNWQKGFQEKLFSLALSFGLPTNRICSYAPEPPEKMVRLSAEYDIGLALEQPVSFNREICLTNKIFTYLLAGNAVLATATKGQRQIMESISNAGTCFEIGDLQAIEYSLRNWHNDRQLLDEARKAAWKAGQQRYNWDVEKEYFLNTVRKTLSGKEHKATIASPSFYTGQ